MYYVLCIMYCLSLDSRLRQLSCCYSSANRASAVDYVESNEEKWSHPNLVFKVIFEALSSPVCRTPHTQVKQHQEIKNDSMLYLPNLLARDEHHQTLFEPTKQAEQKCNVCRATALKLLLPPVFTAGVLYTERSEIYCPPSYINIHFDFTLFPIKELCYCLK